MSETHPATGGIPHTPPASTASNEPAPASASDKIPGDVYIIVAASFLIAVGFGLVAPVLPQFAKSFDVGTFAAAAIVSVFALARLVFAGPAGWLVERFGERATYTWGLSIVAISSAACAFATSYWHLIAFRSVGGLGSVMFTVASMGLVVRLAPPSLRGRVSSLYAGSFLLGMITGPLIGGLLGGLGLRVPFLVYGALLMVAVVIVALRLGRNQPWSRERGSVLPPLTMGEALRDSAYRAALASSFANGWSIFGVRVALVPLFAVAVLDSGPALAGVALTVFAVGTAIMLPFAGSITDRIGRRTPMIVGLLVMAGGLGAMGLTTTTLGFVLTSVIAGLGSGLASPAQQATAADVIGNERSGGKVLATFQMSADVGAIIGPVAAGLIADYAGYGWAFGLSGLLCLLATVPWFIARESRPVAAK